MGLFLGFSRALTPPFPVVRRVMARMAKAREPVPSARFSRSSSRAGLISLSCGAHLSSAAQTMVYFHLDASSLC